MDDSNLNPDDPAEIIKDILTESMALNNNDRQLDAISTDHLLKALLLRLLEEREERRTVVTSSEILATTSANSNAAKKKKMAAAAAAKKKRYKRNKAAAKHKKTKIMLSWLGGGIISLIMVIVFSSIETLTSPFSLIHASDGSGDGEAPPALPPSASRSLRQRGHRSNIDNTASTSPDIISPLPAAVPPIFSPAAVGHLMNEELSSTCLDTPNWKDKFGDGCDYYEKADECPFADAYAGDMGPATDNCCYCGGGSHTLPLTDPPTASSSPSSSSHPTKTCLDTPNWKDRINQGCDHYEEYSDCPSAENLAGDMGPATDHCCHCGGGSHTFPPTNFPTMSLNPTKFCFDTPNWKDIFGIGCVFYAEFNRCVFADAYAGDMGPATDNCCYCGGGSPTLPPTNSPAASSSPTQTCFDTPNWKDVIGGGCDEYEEADECPFADAYAGDMGPATDHCCYCGGGSHTLPLTDPPTASSSPSISSHPTDFCFDTPNWTDSDGEGCDEYEEVETLCGYAYADFWAGDMGPATEHCCYCGGGSSACEDFRSKLHDYFYDVEIKDGVMTPFCKEAESSCCGDHDINIVTEADGDFIKTVGLYNECKCDFWLPLCEDGIVEACDYSSEYCCGDYQYFDSGSFWYAGNSPACYCDFFNYAQNELQHALKPKALNMNKTFWGVHWGQCQYQETYDLVIEKANLEIMYERMNGQNWTKNDGWMDDTVDHCQWYGISCDDTRGFVTSINLRANNLAGKFPVYTEGDVTKFGLVDLYSLKTLDLADNKLTGTIDYRPLYNRRSLSHFDVSGNQLSGEIDVLLTPALTYADFSNNNFTSMRRFDKYKGSFKTLRYCDLSNNAIEINVIDRLKNIPPNMEQFFASNNQIYGSFHEAVINLGSLQNLRQFNMSHNFLSGSLPESLNNLPQLRQLDMSSNALSGQLPIFADSVLSLQELDLSNQTNGLTGSIPEDLGKLQSLKILNLAGNKLGGAIPPSISNMAVLEELDLSTNLLKSSIPPELGLLEGVLKRLDLSNNALSGVIPAEIGQLRGASILLERNQFHSSTNAPLSLCLESLVREFDLIENVTFCPLERYALVDFYNSAKGAEWTDRSNWIDEYVNHCDWRGVTCDNTTNHVTKLSLRNNGLSGKLSESIGNLSSIKVLDLSDNDIKGPIPEEIGLLSSLTYLRLSYNAFTGTAPEALATLTKLQLLQLQSNRITEMPNIPRVDESLHVESAFVTDCGVPSAFDEALECESCTMCCNLNEDCYPQEDTRVEKWGFSYGTFAAVLFAGFVAVCCIIVLSVYLFSKRKQRGNAMTRSAERRVEDEKYALKRIGKDSVYSYFVTDKKRGWLVAFVALGIQVWLLSFFVIASETNLQDDKTDIQFTWQCPRDSDVCKDKSDLTSAGWAIFSLLMIAHLAKDMINGSQLIYHSSKVRHPLFARIRYFISGLGLCSITLFALYAATVYNGAIATSNTDIIINSVEILFVMELDEWLFAGLEAWNENWTKHASDSEGAANATSHVDAGSGSHSEGGASSEADVAADKRGETEEMKEEIALWKDQAARQNDEISMLREAVQKMQASIAPFSSFESTPIETTMNARNEDDNNSGQRGQITAPQSNYEISMPMAHDSEQERGSQATFDCETVSV